jgi:aminoglycoside phosphotransferase (APT) family kinase protein
MDEAQLISYLLRESLVRAESLVDDDLVVTNDSRRHRSYKVISRDGPSYFVKCGVDPERSAVLDQEARNYRYLHSARAGLAAFVPELRAYDRHRSILVVELLPGGQDLRHYQSHPSRFSPVLARSLGRALAAVHRAPQGPGPAAEGGAPRESGARAALAAHLPGPAFLRVASSASIETMKVIQRHPGLGVELDRLQRGWRRTAMIHGDARWENLIAVPRAGASRRTRIKIVDWESGGIGDPCWDVGSVFGDYLSAWLLSIPVTGSSPPERLVELAGLPLSSMQPGIHAFWAAYARGMALHGPTAVDALVRAVRYAGARLVHTALEHAQSSSRLTGPVLFILQLSHNILQRPEEAAAQLLGLPVSAR